MIRPPPKSTPFPTRRSSDLRGSQRSLPIMHDHLVCDDWGETKGATAALDAIAARITGGAAAERRTRARSEEHTSELQSLRHLVCRLLLEKKKHSHPRIHRSD